MDDRHRRKPATKSGVQVDSSVAHLAGAVLMVAIVVSVSDAIRDALLGALLDSVVTLELADDEAADLGLVSGIEEDIGYEFERLGEDDRALLVTLILRRAAVEPDPARREVLEEFPDAFGLLDE